MRLSAPIHQLKRRARLLARDKKIPLHEAQDQIAQAEGFRAWSLLSFRSALSAPDVSLLPRLKDGDMLLIAARPGHGKTLLGLQLLLDAIRDGRRAAFYSLEYTEGEALERIQMLSGSRPAAAPEIVVSDDISADFIVKHLSDAPRGTVAVIDYLQILDQQRSKPSLSEQLTVLQSFTRSTGVILGFISQIDRLFCDKRAPAPSLEDIRLPNPIPVGSFTTACFLHAGEIRHQRMR